jgi:hypothetical protein
LRGSSMPLNISGVRAKLARSQIHAQTIKNEIQSWHDRNPYSLTKQANADFTRYSLILRVNEAPPIERWGLIFGDYLNNLRSALDYLVYAIAAYESSPNPPSYEGKLMFPISTDPADFNDSISKRKVLGDISASMRTEIERLQPYNRPHPELPPVLKIFRSLHNADKHRLPIIVFGAVVNGQIGMKGEMHTDTEWRVRAEPGEVKDGTEIFSALSNRSEPEMEFDRMIFDIVIAIRHEKRDPSGPVGSDRTDIVALMDEISGEVRRIINELAGKIT